MRRRHVWLALAALGLGAATLLYAGPGQLWVRGHVGDVAAAMLVYALLSLVWRGPALARAAITFGFASAVEIGQLYWHVTSTAGELTVGNTFDAGDFVAYAAGVVIGLAWEPRRMR